MVLTACAPLQPYGRHEPGLALMLVLVYSLLTSPEALATQEVGPVILYMLVGNISTWKQLC